MAAGAVRLVTGLKSDVAILYAWQVQASEDRHVASFKTMVVWLFYCFFACRGGLRENVGCVFQSDVL